MLDIDYVRYLVRNHNDELDSVPALLRIAKGQGVKAKELRKAVVAVRAELSKDA